LVDSFLTKLYLWTNGFFIKQVKFIPSKMIRTMHLVRSLHEISVISSYLWPNPSCGDTTLTLVFTQFNNLKLRYSSEHCMKQKNTIISLCFKQVLRFIKLFKSCVFWFKVQKNGWRWSSISRQNRVHRMLAKNNRITISYASCFICWYWWSFIWLRHRLVVITHTYDQGMFQCPTPIPTRWILSNYYQYWRVSIMLCPCFIGCCCYCCCMS